ncbi:HemK2/MTQ2 family protein methyltransferase [Streptomyces sp. NPDC002896]|uniref:HemK2/MTQ2 family protein methyltransferase n=1 Tax=Streptomyces sp. NPDC002896 TaxID=3154438 RepID=UPI00331A2E27
MTTAAAVRLPGMDHVLTLPGVYAPQYDTYLLAEALRREAAGAGTDVLDVGTGSGALALYAARLGARVTATDISRRAVVTARLNALLAGRHISVHRGDLLEPVRGRSYDIVLSNPPYVPTPPGSLPRNGAARSWDAGPDGRAFVDRICDAAPSLLRPHGALLLVHSALCGTEATLQRLSAAGLWAEVTDRMSVPFGPVVRSRLSWLRSRGLLDINDEQEELVVVRAERI